MPRPKPPSRFGMNEPAAGRAARASHSLNLAAGATVALLPGLWSFMWNLVWWPHGVSTLSNLCLSAQLLALGSIVCAHWVTFNFCQYDPLRDWLEQYAGFMFLYRGRAEMLAVLTVLSLGNTQWDASTSQLLVTLGACLLCAASAGLSLYVLDRQPELDRVMTEQLEIAAEQRQAALAVAVAASRDAALAAYGDGSSAAAEEAPEVETGGGGDSSDVVDYSQVPRDSIPVESMAALPRAAAAGGGRQQQQTAVEFP